MTTRHSENWEYYPAEINGHVASVRVDMNLQQPFTHTFLFQIPYASYDNGLIVQEDIQRVESIEDSVHDFILEHHLPIKHIGTILSNGKSDFYFSTNEELAFEDLIHQHMATFPSDTYQIIELDFDVYAELLYPNPMDQATILNRDMVMDLEKKGDMLTQSRVATYLIEFQDEANRDAFNKLLPRSIQVQVTEKPLVLGLNMDLIPTFANLNECSYYLIQAFTPFKGRLIGVEMQPIVE